MSGRYCRWLRMKVALAASVSPDELGLPLASGLDPHDKSCVNIPTSRPPWLPKRGK
jgi:hypothetical protein